MGETELSIEMLEEAVADIERKYPSRLHPILMRDHEMLAQELERRARGYGGAFRTLLITAAHVIRIPKAPHD